MEAIIPAVDKALIKGELNSERFLRKTNKANNDIYVVNAHNAPNVMREIARLREIAYRNGGGGTGLEWDIDQYDTMNSPYQQLVLFDPQAEEIIGGYRFIEGKRIKLDADGQPDLATSHIFRFSETFTKDYLPYTIELGRSFIQPDYQSSKMGAKSLFALDNLWDGLGALVVLYPECRYFFGKVTMYSYFDPIARDLILSFIHRYFPDKDRLVRPHKLFRTGKQLQEKEALFAELEYKEAYKILNTTVRKRGMNIPPLINAYMSLSPTMKYFGTTIDEDFSNVYETGILITIEDIFEEKHKRYIESAVNSLPKHLIEVVKQRYWAFRNKRGKDERLITIG